MIQGGFEKMENREYRNYLLKCRRMRPDVKEKAREYNEKYKKTHPDYMEKHREADKKYYERNRTLKIQKIAYYNARSCKDPVVGDVCKYNTLIQRIRHHPDWYEGVKAKDCLIKVPTIKGLDEQLKSEYNL